MIEDFDDAVEARDEQWGALIAHGYGHLDRHLQGLRLYVIPAAALSPFPR